MFNFISCRNFLKKMVFLILVINLAAIVVYSVGDDKIVDLQLEVVHGYLVERLLRDLNVWSFVFNDENRHARAVVNHSVATFLHIVHFYRHFIPY